MKSAAKSNSNLFGEFFGGVSPDFGERGMIMRHGGEFVDSHVLLHAGDDLVDKFAAGWTDATASENFAGFRIGNQFYEAVEGFHNHRFAVVVEGIGGGEIGSFFEFGFAFGEADAGDLRVGEDDA